MTKKKLSLIIAFALTVPSILISVISKKGISSKAATYTAITYEAEDAFINGADVASTVEGYSGTGYVDGLKDDSDYIEFTVEVPASGSYTMYIGYSAPYGYKQETVSVNNGAQSFSAIFEENTAFEETLGGVIKLNAGENTIKISRFWGWTLLDYIKIGTADSLEIPTDIPDTLCNPNATAETQKLMTYLCSIYGKNILSGQFAYTTKYTEIDAIYNNTGKYPAVIGLDFSDYSPSRVALGCNPGQDTDKAIEWWNNGGLVTFCWHWASPIGGDTGNNKWGTFYTENTTYDLSVAMDDHTSEEYTTLIRDIDVVAEQLKILQDAGVPVLWRPLHEASGGWFWWGAAGSDSYKELWTLMYDRLTNYHGINNLIWVWNAQNADWYPGDKYVDIIGEDIYAEKQDNSSQINGFLKALAYTDTHKLITLSENGVLPDPDELQADHIPWSWLNTWGGEFVVPWVGSTDYTETYTSLSMLKKFYSHDYVLTRDELPSALFDSSSIVPTTAPTATTAPTVKPTATVAPTTIAPTTIVPTTIAPTTIAPTTIAPTTAPSGDVTADLTVTNDWGAGAVCSVTITNNTGIDFTNGWTFEFDFTRDISDVWSATFAKGSNGHFTVSNPAWDSTLANGKSYTFSFMAGADIGAGSVISNFSLK